MTDEPAEFIVFAFGSISAASCKHLGRRRVRSECEQLRWLGKIGYKARVHNEIAQYGSVDEESGDENYQPAF